MFLRIILAFVVSVLQQGALPKAGDVQAALTRGESLYFLARFADSISVLQPLDTALQAQADRIRERVLIKLYLALAHIGSNELEAARTLFVDILQLDPMFSLEANRFATKVMNLFEEAKAETTNNSCIKIYYASDR